MKKDTERKNFYEAKLHEKRSIMHVHIAKDLRTKLGTKKRALLVNKGDSVKIMRGGNRGKSGKVARLNYNKLSVYIEGISRKNAKGTEMLIAFHPSNLLLTDLSMSAGRKKEFGLAPQKDEPKI